MRRLYIPIILFLLLALEGVAIDFLPSVLTDHKTLLIPHWVLIYSFLIALFYDHDYTYYSMIYAAIFGFLIDIVYTDILGVYMFAYALGTYIVLLLKRAFHVSFLLTIILTIIGVSVADVFIYLIYSLIEVAHLDPKVYIWNRLVPTLLANIIFLILIYIVSKRHLQRLKTSFFD